MKLLSGMVGEIGGIINNLTLSSQEKKKLETEVTQTVYGYADNLSKSRAAAVQAEANGNWLQRSWRPIVMLTFAFILLLGVFVNVPLLKDTSRFWDLLELGLGGYVIGRSAEKVSLNLLRRKK